MKPRRRSPFLLQSQLWIALLCCVCTTAVAAPTSKKKKSSKSSTKKSQVVRKAEPVPEPEILPGGVPATRAQAVIVIDARTGEVLYEKNADQQRAPAKIGRAHV